MPDLNKESLSPGERLQVLLDELGLTQTALARMVDASPQYVNNIVRGGQRVTEDFAIEVARVTKANLHWLFTGQGPMLQPEEFIRESEAGYESYCLESLLRETARRLRQVADRISELETPEPEREED